MRFKLLNSTEIENFIKQFGTFFEEFKSNGISSWMFYVLFVIRRYVIVLLILFIDDVVLQLVLSGVFSYQ